MKDHRRNMEIREFQENDKNYVEVRGVTFTFKSYLKFTFTIYLAIVLILIALNLLGLLFQSSEESAQLAKIPLEYTIITTAYSLVVFFILVFVSYPVYLLISRFRSGQRFIFREEK